MDVYGKHNLNNNAPVAAVVKDESTAGNQPQMQKVDSETGKEHSPYQHVEHTFEPVFDEHSEILILGTFPSVKSREQNFYYGHPQNRFWKVIAKLTGEELPQTVEEKKSMLLKHHIAVWDVVQSCDIIGSSDSSIRNVVPADLKRIIDVSPIRKIYANGDKAYRLYKKYCWKETDREIIKLPSTSPANAIFSLDRLTETWKENININGE